MARATAQGSTLIEVSMRYIGYGLVLLCGFVAVYVGFDLASGAIRDKRDVHTPDRWRKGGCL